MGLTKPFNIHLNGTCPIKWRMKKLPSLIVAKSSLVIFLLTKQSSSLKIKSFPHLDFLLYISPPFFAFHSSGKFKFLFSSFIMHLLLVYHFPVAFRVAPARRGGVNALVKLMSKGSYKRFGFLNFLGNCRIALKKSKK